jgi:EmrB/QacA subfamily drug resistance transporter
MKDGVNKTTVLFVASLASFLTPFMGSSINIALPSIGAEFASDAVLLSWVPTAYLLSSAIFIVPFGRLADIHGKVKIFSWGIVVYTLGSLLSALAPSVIMLIGVRLLQGVGAAMIYGTGVALITTVFPAEERGRALGINVAAVYLGLSLGPFIGGALTQALGWRSIFLANVVCGAVIIFFVATRLKADQGGSREPFDALGSVIYGTMLLFLMYGFSILPESMGFILIIAGSAGFFAFMNWEKRTEHPVLDISLFTKNRVFAFSNLAALINYSATFAIAFLLSLYLQYIKGIDPLAAGVVLIAQPVVQTIFSPPAGRLSDRIEPGVIASAGMAVCAVALLLFSTLDADSTLIFIIATEILVGVGFALFSSPNTNAVMTSVVPRQYGVASGTLASMRLIGMMFSMGLVMLLFSLFIGRVQITPELYPAFLISMKAAFVLFAVLCGIGTVASYQRGRLRQ